MTKTAICLLLVPLGTFAQLETTITARADGQQEIMVRNVTGAQLSAFAATWLFTSKNGATPRARMFVYQDCFVDRGFKALAGGEQTTLKVGSTVGGVTDVRILASAFEDGSTSGDADWVRMILRRRGSYLRALNAGIQELQPPSVLQMTQPALLQRLTDSRDRELAAANSSTGSETAAAADMHQIFDEKADSVKKANLEVVFRKDSFGSIQVVYRLLLGNVRNLPSRRDGTVLSLTETIQVLTKVLNEQKAGLLSSKHKPL